MGINPRDQGGLEFPSDLEIHQRLAVKWIISNVPEIAAIQVKLVGVSKLKQGTLKKNIKVNVVDTKEIWLVGICGYLLSTYFVLHKKDKTKLKKI